ncbi:hypothetical protein [Roseateles sp. LYH14W]|uniref:Nuclear transport factor 2 family protein n=1 Tax=Pelomonas parva TaxID=3299032 RepID=A0ABW7F5I5_9BURK
MDAALFEAAFVSCGAGKFRAIFTDDAEFHHDKAGASFGDAVKVMKSCPRDNGVTRTLVTESISIADSATVHSGSSAVCTNKASRWNGLDRCCIANVICMAHWGCARGAPEC